MAEILRALLFTPTPWGWGIPTLVTGAPGEGKSSVAVDVCRSVGAPYVLLSPGECGEAYFGAVPAVQDSRITYPRPSWTDGVADGGVVIVDELRTAPLTLRPALLGLTLDRRVGGHAMGRNVAVLALSNSAEDSPNGLPLDPPQANRFLHIAWQALSGSETGDVVARQLAGHTIIPTSELGWRELRADIESRAPAALKAAGAAVSEFLAAHPMWARKKPEKDGDCAWPSPRSWALAGCALAAASLHDLSAHCSHTLLAGAVGDQAAAAYVQHQSTKDLPSVRDLLSGKVQWDASTARPDQIAYLTSGLATAVTASNALRVAELLLAWAPYHRNACVHALADVTRRFAPSLHAGGKAFLKQVELLMTTNVPILREVPF